MNAPITTMAHRVVGTKARRIEDPALLRGKGRYLSDIKLDGELQAVFVRSPHAHAKILSIECTAARQLSGVVAVYTAEDISKELTKLRMPLGFPSTTLQSDITPFVLAYREVAFVGEAIVMVVAESRYIAEDAAALVEISYEPLEAIVDCRKALDPAAPKVRTEAISNIAEHVRLGYGEVTQAFNNADHVFHEEIFVHRGAAHPIEGRGVLARYEREKAELTVWSSTQMAHELMHTLADMLGMDQHFVRVITPDVGGGFGAKYLVYPEEIAIPAVARTLGRPVKWVEDRMEHFLSAIQERDQYWYVDVAVNKDGRLLGIRGKLLHDQGAYTPQGINLAFNAASSISGPYIVPTYEMDVYACQTNKAPVIPVRGAGYPQAAFVMDRLLDRIARELHIDRAEVRQLNLIPKEKMPYAKGLRSRAGVAAIIDSGDYQACQKKALDVIDYAGFAKRKAAARVAGRFIGNGVANCVKGTSRGPFESALVRVSPTGRVTVYTGAMAMGQGIGTSLAQVCAEQLGLAVDAVDVTTGDTGHIPLGMGGFASRQAVMAGNAVFEAAREVREKALKTAASILEARIEDLVIRNGRVEVNGVPGHGISLADIAKKLKGAPGYAMPKGVTPGLEAAYNYQLDAQAHANACHACEVEVDPQTGHVLITRYVAVHDSGTLINPLIAEGQVHGGIAHGIGNALYEKMIYDAAGQPISTTFADYLIPFATEIPKLEIFFIESPSPTNPLGVKGIGETGIIPVAAVIISAVENALMEFNLRICEAPVSPVRILELINKSKTTEAGT